MEEQAIFVIKVMESEEQVQLLIFFSVIFFICGAVGLAWFCDKYKEQKAAEATEEAGANVHAHYYSRGRNSWRFGVARTPSFEGSGPIYDACPMAGRWQQAQNQTILQPTFQETVVRVELPREPRPKSRPPPKPETPPPSYEEVVGSQV